MTPGRRGVAAILLAAAVVLAPTVPVGPGAEPASADRSFGDAPLDDVLHWAAQHRRCGLTTNKLAALMLAPTYPETGTPSGQAPSPMTLSRWDPQPGLHSFGTVAGEPRAFWHPGVGMWQFDSAGLGAPFTAAQRIDTYVVAAQTAATMADRWCDNPSLSYVWAPWYGCGSTTCRNIYRAIYRPATDRLVGVTRALGVTARGGMQRRTCTGAARGGSFACWRIDPARAQGYAGFRAAGFGPAPVTAPFYVYAAGGREYRHWLARDTGYARDIWATRPLSGNARTSLRWHRGTTLTVGSGPTPVAGFTDVPEAAWYREALTWAGDGEIVAGYPDRTFRPGVAVTRAQAVTWLWTLAGAPEAPEPAGLGDVGPGAWYRDALGWAQAEGVVTGFPDGTFRANDPVNRAQLASMLWNLAQRPSPTRSTGFGDVGAGSWYHDAVAWLVDLGYASGFPNGTFRPGDPLTRAQGVSWLHAARPFDDVGLDAWYREGVDWGRHRRVVTAYPDHTFRGDEDADRGTTVAMLWGLAGRPEGSPPHGFTDVAPTDPAVAWAAAKEVASGYPDSTFRPASAVTRAQAVVMQWRLAGRAEVTATHAYSDVAATAWFADALAWADRHGIVTGHPDGTFRPDDAVTRAQLVSQLHALASTPSAWVVAPPGTVVF